MKTKKQKGAWPKASAKTKSRPKLATNGKAGKGHPPIGHARDLWKSDEDFANFMAILEENSKW